MCAFTAEIFKMKLTSVYSECHGTYSMQSNFRYSNNIRVLISIKKPFSDYNRCTNERRILKRTMTLL